MTKPSDSDFEAIGRTRLFRHVPRSVLESLMESGTIRLTYEKLLIALLAYMDQF